MTPFKISTSGDYVQLIYVDSISESVQQELKSDTDAFEASYDSDGKLFMQFGAMRFENPDPTDFTINGSAVTDAADFITKLNALFTGGGGGGATIYTGDGSLSGVDGDPRTIDLAEMSFRMQYDADDWLLVDPVNKKFRAYVDGEDLLQQYEISMGTSQGSIDLFATENSVDPDDFVEINLNSGGRNITYTADTHTFNGNVIGASLFQKSGTGTATGDITGNLNGHDVTIQNDDIEGPLFYIDNDRDISSLFSPKNGDDGGSQTGFDAYASTADGIFFDITTRKFGENIVEILGDATTHDISYTAATHTFVGAVILPTSDPHVAGALWNNAGTPAISAG